MNPALLCVAVHGDRICDMGLPLDCIGAGLVRFLDDLHCGVELANVVCGEVGDDVLRLIADDKQLPCVQPLIILKSALWSIGGAKRKEPEES